VSLTQVLEVFCVVFQFRFHILTYFNLICELWVVNCKLTKRWFDVLDDLMFWCESGSSESCCRFFEITTKILCIKFCLFNF
jgi:hypothetical protein